MKRKEADWNAEPARDHLLGIARLLRTDAFAGLAGNVGAAAASAIEQLLEEHERLTVMDENGSWDVCTCNAKEWPCPTLLQAADVSGLGA